jgi:hypothetical protein
MMLLLQHFSPVKAKSYGFSCGFVTGSKFYFRKVALLVSAGKLAVCGQNYSSQPARSP